MSAQPDLLPLFHALERTLEAQPDGVVAEIICGAFAMSPRPRPRHMKAEGKLTSILDEQLGRPRKGKPPDWLFLPEPELRSLRAFSRVSPDLAGWRRSTTGWPDPDATPIELMPEWVVEVLSQSTEKKDRGGKRIAYGTMGVGWLWLVDVARERIEVYRNERGEMVRDSDFSGDGPHRMPPFRRVKLAIGDLWWWPGGRRAKRPRRRL